MLSRFIRACLFTAAATLCSVAPATDLPLTGDVAQAQAVWRTFEKWIGAYDAGDLDGVMAIFDPDVQFAFQGAPDQRFADLRAGYVADFKSRAPGVSWVPAVQEIHAEGRIAFVRSIWELHAVKDGKPQVIARNRSIDVLHIDGNGRWVIFRSMNYPEKS